MGCGIQHYPVKLVFTLGGQNKMWRHSDSRGLTSISGEFTWNPLSDSQRRLAILSGGDLV